MSYIWICICGATGARVAADNRTARLAWRAHRRRACPDKERAANEFLCYVRATRIPPSVRDDAVPRTWRDQHGVRYRLDAWHSPL